MSSSSVALCARVAALALACSVLCACNGEADRRAEARALLEKLNRLTANGTLTERSAALAALDLVPLRDPKHAQTRDVCRAAHQQLLSAETAQASARKALEEATVGTQPGGAPLSPERGQAIADELKSSNESLAAAKRDFPKCEQATVELTAEAR